MLLLYFQLISFVTSSTLGVDPKQESLFANKLFKCFDGSKSISISSVNDDYCDCLDGSDEPGTSACSNGKFYCLNAGHVGKIITSSRVGDGICDCCDGSDENKTCINSCKELAKQAEIKQRELNEMRLKGLREKDNYIQAAKEIKTSQRNRISKLKQDISLKEKEITDIQLLLDKLREKEQVVIEYEKQHKRNCCTKLLSTREEIGLFINQIDEFSNEMKLFKDSVDLLKMETEEFKVFKEKFDKLSNVWNSLNISKMKEMAVMEQVSTDFQSEEDVGDEELETDRETEDVQPETTRKVPDVIEESHEVKLLRQWAEDEKHTSQSVHKQSVAHHLKGIYDSLISPLQSFIPSTKSDDEDGGAAIEEDSETIKKKVNDVSNDLEKLKTTKSEFEKEEASIKEKLSRNYGPHDVFTKMDGECFEYKVDQYIYKMCPFGSADQNSDTGHLVAHLGKWEEWKTTATTLIPNSEFFTMKFVNGAQCWNGPQRSLIVHVSCGLNNQISNVREPNKCEYHMDFVTPAVCIEEKVTETLKDEI